MFTEVCMTLLAAYEIKYPNITISYFQTNVPCADNMAFDMERLTRGQLGNRRSVLGELSSDSTLSLEPLRTSGISQFPQDGELTPRTGEINIAVTSK